MKGRKDKSWMRHSASAFRAVMARAAHKAGRAADKAAIQEGLEYQPIHDWETEAFDWCHPVYEWKLFLLEIEISS